MLLKTIKEVCRSCGVTEGALRYYDEKNIVSPVIKEETGRKRWLYDEETVEKIKRVKLLRYIGLSVDEIGISLSDRETLSASLQKRLNVLLEEKVHIETELAILQTLMAGIGMNSFYRDNLLSESDAEILQEVMVKLMKECTEDEKS